jgi:DNA-binding MarR family transcriptional regulator
MDGKRMESAKRVKSASKAAGHKKLSFKGRIAQINQLGEVKQDFKDEPANRYDITKQVGHLLRKAYQTHVAIFQSLNICPQITPTQFAVLCAVKDCGPCSLTVIGRRIVMDLATIRGIIERLHKRGLVSFSRDDTDRRQVIARLEPKGRELIERIIPSAQKITEVTVQKLTVAERVALQYLLEKISTTDLYPIAVERDDAEASGD